MTLGPPRMIHPGACSCYPEGCYCSPENLGEIMSQASLARIHRYAALDKGDHATAARHHAEQLRLGALVTAALKPQPAATTAAGRHDTMKQQNERAELVREIWQLSTELSTRHDAAEDLNARSDAYLTARRDSLREWKERERATRASAVRRSDAESVRAALRFDATPTDGEYREARARVFSSGVPEVERDSWTWRVANHLAWSRARDRLLAETAAARLDSLGGEPQPTELDRLRAARDLEGSVPLGAAGRADAYAAQRHERAIDARARELAGARVRAEAQAQALANMPAAPPEPRLPAAPLPHAYLRQEADAEERAARGPDTWPPRRRS